MNILNGKDPWWLVFKIVIVILIGMSIWSIHVLPPPHRGPIVQQK